MTKTLAQRAKQAKQKPEAAMTRRYEPEEFDADTAEERPMALLAEKRRQFLAERYLDDRHWKCRSIVE